MSIRVTVNSNHSSDCSRRLLKDVETEKRNEWNRRRLLRIQQVRQQSKDFANSLREKVHGEGDFQKENYSKQWQEKTLDRITDKYRDCLKDIGLAHTKAARQPDPDEILREERLRNAVITGIRGESAMCLLKCRQQMRKLEETVPTRLKAFVRAKEDLRSTMIASLPHPQPRPKRSPLEKKCSPVKRRVVATKHKKPRHVLKEIPSNLPEDYVTVIKGVPGDDKVEKCCGSGNINDDDNEQELSESPKYKCHCSPKKANLPQPPESKATETNHQRRKLVRVEEAGCSKDTGRQRRYSDECHASDLEDSYDSDTTWPPRSRHSSSSGQGHVHCYDHANRHQSSRPVPSVASSYVRRVADEDGRKPCLRTAHEADMRAKLCEAEGREERMREQAKRGEEALRRQQRRNDFDRLMLELSKLNREERKLRYTNWTKASTELGDTQRKTAINIRQKKMEAAFEMEFMDPIIEDENKKEPVSTPKLNVAEWKSAVCAETLEVSRARQNDKLTLSNLMKRINEQREMLFQETRNEADDRNGTAAAEHSPSKSSRVEKVVEEQNISEKDDGKGENRRGRGEDNVKAEDKAERSPSRSSRVDKVVEKQNISEKVDGKGGNRRGRGEDNVKAEDKAERSPSRSSRVDKVVEKQNVSEKVDRKGETSLGKGEDNVGSDGKNSDRNWTDGAEHSPSKRRVDKVVEKENISEKVDGKGETRRGRGEDHVGSDEKNSDSSLSTLYSLDMALSQVAVDRNDDKDNGSSANMKGLRITVKVTGGKEYIDKKKKKKTTKTEEEKLLKECRKMLEDKGNVRKRNVSGETTSTSYRSPPDRLSPKQLQLLKDLLKQIEGKSDEKGMPLLKRYILRLLSMNRESIDCLGISSSDVSLQSSLMREMVGNFVDSRYLECEDVTMKHVTEKGVQVSLVESTTKNERRKQRRNVNVDTNPLEGATNGNREQKRNFTVDEDISNDKIGKQGGNRKLKPYQQAPSAVDGCCQGVVAEDAAILDDLDVLTQQINKYFETRQNDKSDEIVKKYMELAKRYTDRISNLADLIGDVDTDVPSSLIRSRTDQESTDSTKTNPNESSEIHSSPIGSQTYNETSYMTLPPEINVPFPTRRLEPLQRISPTFNQDKRQDISWHEALSHPLPTRISPAPDEAKFFRPKPPPTILNNHNNHMDPDLRTSSPHELSTINEVDTPSTSWRRDFSQQMATSSPRKRSSHPFHQDPGSGYRIPPPNESIPLDSVATGSSRNQKISDESFQTMKSDDNSGSFSELDLEEKDILDESMPDVMQELIRRNIMSSPYEWLKEMQEREGTAQNIADEEVRRIMGESPEDLEAALKSLGIGWASTTLRKTRQAGELSGDSSSPPAVRPAGTPIETSTPQSGKPQAMPVMGSETEISAIRLIATSSSDLALTPPDISLKPPNLSSNSSDTRL